MAAAGNGPAQGEAPFTPRRPPQTWRAIHFKLRDELDIIPSPGGLQQDQGLTLPQVGPKSPSYRSPEGPQA